MAKKVTDELRSKGHKVEYLDGDALREVFPNTGFSKEERDTHIKRVGYLASRLEHNGVFVVAAFVSPYEDARAFVRNLCDNFIEVYVSTPLEICEKRDPKGLYKKARAGEIKNFTGIDDPYEPPQSPELTLDTSKIQEAPAVETVLKLTKV